jgi:hypothetical protein
MELRELLGPMEEVAAGMGFQILVTVVLWTIGRGIILMLTKLAASHSRNALGVARGASLVLSAALFAGIVFFVGPAIATFGALVLAIALESAWRGPAMGARKAARR